MCVYVCVCPQIISGTDQRQDLQFSYWQVPKAIFPSTSATSQTAAASDTVPFKDTVGTAPSPLSISSKALAQDVHPCPTSGLPPVGLSCLTHSYSAGDAPCAAHARVFQLNLEKMLLPVWLQQKRDQQGLQHLTSNTTWSFVLPCPRCQQFEGCADRLQPSHNLLQPLQRQEEKRHPEPIYSV